MPASLAVKPDGKWYCVWLAVKRETGNAESVRRQEDNSGGVTPLDTGLTMLSVYDEYRVETLGVFGLEPSSKSTVLPSSRGDVFQQRITANRMINFWLASFDG